MHIDDLNTEGSTAVSTLMGAVSHVEKLPFFIPPPPGELLAPGASGDDHDDQMETYQRYHMYVCVRRNCHRQIQ